MVALVFHLAPERAEPVSLLIGTVFAIAAGVTSVLRLSRADRGRARRGGGLSRASCMLAGAIGLEPTTLGFGDRCSTD